MFTNVLSEVLAKTKKSTGKKVKAKTKKVKVKKVPKVKIGSKCFRAATEVRCKSLSPRAVKIIAGVIGGVVAIVAIVFLLTWYRRRQKAKTAQPDEPKSVIDDNEDEAQGPDTKPHDVSRPSTPPLKEKEDYNPLPMNDPPLTMPEPRHVLTQPKDVTDIPEAHYQPPEGPPPGH